MDEMTMPEFAHFRTKCETPDCMNEGIELISYAVKDDPWVECGPCETRITDVELVSE
jgi:hypothetical protein